MNLDSNIPLHILYLIDELKVKGGTEKHLFELSTGMAAAGFRISVFTLDEGEYAEEFKNNSNISYRCLNVTRIYDLKGLSAVFSIAQYIKQQQVNILQSFHSASDLIGPLAAILSLRKTRILSSRRDLGYTKSDRHVQMQRYINFFVDGILANSSAVKQSVIEKEGYPESQIDIIFNGIDTGVFSTDDSSRQKQRCAMGVNDQAVLVGSVGNIRPVKGYDILVEAAAIVCKSDQAVRFSHAGEGALKEQLEARCMELGISDRFNFMGANRDVQTFLSALDIYVQPSRSEGLSNAIIEAMAARLPVVATDVGGNPDLIENDVTGLLTPSEDSSALAEKILQLVRQPTMRSALADRAFNKVLEKFQLTSMIDNYKNKYIEITK